MCAWWLVKSEPEEFSIDDLAARGTETWTGVRNYQARNYMMKGMRLGDSLLFYHSNAKPPALVGWARVTREAFPDPSQFDAASPYYDPKSRPEAPRWHCVEIGFGGKFPRALSLAELRTVPELRDMVLLRPGTRLSVTPVAQAEADWVMGQFS